MKTMKRQRDKQVMGHELKGFRSLIDLYKRSGAVSHKVSEKGKAAVDSMLAVYHDRLTYTFVMGREVASIHYNRDKGEIFFKGHNISNMQLDKEQRQALLDLAKVLMHDEQGKPFYDDYNATLARYLADT